MNEQEALSKLKAPGDRRQNAGAGFNWGVIQILVGRACDLACVHCTQASNLTGKAPFISVENFEKAVVSLSDYYGTVGVFGGSPSLHPQFPELCAILSKHIPFHRRGIWSNHPHGHGKIMRETFNPKCSNLNCHGVRSAYDEFKRDWPESDPIIADGSRHSPTHGSQIDLGISEEQRWENISKCDIGLTWSAIVGEVNGNLRAFGCEVMLAQCNLLGIDTGIEVTPGWWRKPISEFAHQYRTNCHNCIHCLKGYGDIDGDPNAVERTTELYKSVYRPKKPGRHVEIVTDLVQLQTGRISRSTDYLGNSHR